MNKVLCVQYAFVVYTYEKSFAFKLGIILILLNSNHGTVTSAEPFTKCTFNNEVFIVLRNWNPSL